MVDFVARYAPTKDDSDGPIFQVAKDWMIVIGDKDVMPAVEMGARYMHEGEMAVVWSHSKYALGPVTRSHQNYVLPPDSHVRLEITVKSIETTSNDPHYNLRVCKSKKEIGNDIFQNEWSNGDGRHRALYLYQKAANGLSAYLQSSNAKTEEASRMLVDCLNNVAAVYIKAKEYHAAKEACVRVLELEPTNYKALIRVAKSTLLDSSSSFEEVEAAIDAAAKVAKGSPTDVKKLKADFLRRKKKYDTKSKKMFSKQPSNFIKEAPAPREADRTDDLAQRERSEATDDANETLEAPLEGSKWTLYNWRQWPWKDTILPYGIQLVLPFFTYSVFLMARRKQPSSDTMLQQDVDHDEF